MSEIIPRMKTAMGDAAETAGQSGALRTARLSDVVLEAMARAAIAALREPTDAMLDAGYQESGPIDGAIAYAIVGNIWRAMAAAVLSE